MGLLTAVAVGTTLVITGAFGVAFVPLDRKRFFNAPYDNALLAVAGAGAGLLAAGEGIVLFMLLDEPNR